MVRAVRVGFYRKKLGVLEMECDKQEREENEGLKEEACTSSEEGFF
jgi:hypothetical protein